MLFFVVELDEERIEKDDIINLDVAYECIEETFAQLDVTLYSKEGTVRYYTRNIDKHDFEYLWMVNKVMKKANWFMDNVIIWRFINIEDGIILEEEDLLEDE